MIVWRNLMIPVVALLATLLLQQTLSVSPNDCLYAVSKYRNCTCGVQYRIVEERCCSDHQCLQPHITTENLTCPFECRNGGRYDPIRRQCFCTPGHYGLCCEIETRLCGGLFVKAEGNFTSLDYPQPYPNNVNCVWRISTDPLRRIALGTRDKEFEVESGSTRQSCNYDYVSVRDGTSENSPELGRFCGEPNSLQALHTIYSTTSHMYVQFTSDYIQRKKGFHLQYKTFYAGQECGPYTRFELPKGTLTSPQYPLEYRPKEQCVWVIALQPPYTQVVLIVETIDMPATPLCRVGDRILVTGIKGSHRKPLAVLCGTRAYKPYRVSGYDEIELEFTSDSQYQGRGFVLSYQQE